jgi:hypothetical protein
MCYRRMHLCLSGSEGVLKRSNAESVESALLIGFYLEILNLRFPVCESHRAEDYESFVQGKAALIGFLRVPVAIPVVIIVGVICV